MCRYTSVRCRDAARVWEYVGERVERKGCARVYVCARVACVGVGVCVDRVRVPNCTYSKKRNIRVNARWRPDGPGTYVRVGNIHPCLIYFNKKPYTPLSVSVVFRRSN